MIVSTPLCGQWASICRPMLRFSVFATTLSQHKHLLTLTVLVTTIDALGHFETW